MDVILGGREVNLQLQYKKCKKTTLEITPEGLITLKVPSSTSMEEINRYLNKQAKQILNALDRIENRRYISANKSYEEEENFLFLGKVYPLKEVCSMLTEDSSSETNLQQFTKETDLQQLLKKFYITKTREIMKERVAHYEKILGVSVREIKIVDTKATWGTCSTAKVLTFNYRLSMAPLPVIDSVVIHELCHLFHMNHDRSFWRKVGSYDPYYKEHQDYLARFGPYMTI